MTTEWPARVVGDRVLCGRQLVAIRQYVCQGQLADVREVGGRRVAAYPSGYVEDPPGWFLPTARSRQSGGTPRLRRPVTDNPGGGPSRDATAPLRVTRTRCPHCRCTAIVPGDFGAVIQSR